MCRDSQVFLELTPNLFESDVTKKKIGHFCSLAPGGGGLFETGIKIG